MEKTIGDKTTFAIQYNLILVTSTNYFGDFWFWINGERIGADDADTYLSSCVHNLKEFFIFKEIRRFASSTKKSGAEIFYLLHERFFDDDAVKSGMYVNLGIFRAIFWLDEIGDANTRDEVKMVLIDEPEKNRQRLIWKKYASEVLNEYFIAYGLFEEVSLAFIKEIENDVVNWKPAE